jgi:type II secretory pathway component GspD/PulD (secretin)
VLIRDGQTVVIGGLVKDESTVTEKKIPFFGDLPFIGKWMFTRKNIGSDSSPTEKTDLLIFVTAHILKDTDQQLIGHESKMVSSLPRPFKLEPRETK